MDRHDPEPDPVDTAVPRRVSGAAWRQILLGGALHQLAWFWTMAMTGLAWGLVLDAGGLPDGSLVLLPALGVLGLGALLRRAVGHLRLARDGYRTRGRLVKFGESAYRVGGASGVGSRGRPSGAPVYALTFEFHDHLGRPHRAQVLSPEPSHLTDDSREPLLFDPDDPDRAALVDHLPGELRVGLGGRVEAKHPDSSLPIVILPAVTVLGNLLALGLWATRAPG